MMDLPFDYDTLLSIIQVVIVIISSFVIVAIFNRLVSVAEKRAKVRKGHLIHFKRFFQLTIYSIALILILWIYDVNVIGLVAGLGVGAIVIGFALKDIIENWISGLLIISGRTYQIGDVIRVGELSGVVRDIGLRTTKLRTYDRNEIIIPNSILLKQNIINLTSGKRESVTSISFSIDYVFDIQTAKKIIENILKDHPNVVVDEKKKREIRFVIRSKEWTVEIESLFWINDTENEEFIKSEIAELVKKRFEEENILPPLPGVMRNEYLENKKKRN
jgi:small-conductance mechanosensitive channel